MESLFITLSRAVEGAPVWALSAAFVWGVLSIILSPCHLASIPLIVGFISGQGAVETKRAFTISALFAMGILVTIAAVGAVTAAAGRMMGDVGAWGNYFVAILFFLVGLHLIGVIPMPWSGAGQVGMKKTGLTAAFILGLVFGIALGPCTFAYMAPVLAVAFKVGNTNFLYGAALLLAYGLGHCSVIVAAGTSTELVQHFLNWNEKSKGIAVVKFLCGILVILGGIYLIITGLQERRQVDHAIGDHEVLRASPQLLPQEMFGVSCDRKVAALSYFVYGYRALGMTQGKVFPVVEKPARGRRKHASTLMNSLSKPLQRLLGGFIRMHILHHAEKGTLCGNWMTEDLRHHGYKISPGTLYPMLRAMEKDGWIAGSDERSGSHRRLYRMTPDGRKALKEVRAKLRELFSEVAGQTKKKRTPQFIA